MHGCQANASPVRIVTLAIQHDGLDASHFQTALKVVAVASGSCDDADPFERLPLRLKVLQVRGNRFGLRVPGFEVPDCRVRSLGQRPHAPVGVQAAVQVVDVTPFQQGRRPRSGLLRGPVVQRQLLRPAANANPAMRENDRPVVDPLVTVSRDEEVVLSLRAADRSHQAECLGSDVLRLVDDDRRVGKRLL